MILNVLRLIVDYNFDGHLKIYEAIKKDWCLC
jgi:hypothetical protein